MIFITAIVLYVLILFKDYDCNIHFITLKFINMLLKKEKCKKKWLQYIKLKTSEELETNGD